MNRTLKETILYYRKKQEESRELFTLCPYPSEICDGTGYCKCLTNKSHDGCLVERDRYKQVADWLEELLEHKNSRGEWTLYGRNYKCSKCGELIPWASKYCPNCGVKMSEPFDAYDSAELSHNCIGYVEFGKHFKDMEERK